MDKKDVENPTINSWISVNDRLPKKGKGINCLIIEDIYGNTEFGYWTDNKFLYADYTELDGVVTHWQPLPEPPNKVK